jgi:hypothetical protein
MKEKIKDLGWSLLGIAFFIGLMLLAVLFIKGGLLLNATLYPWLVLISGITFVISLLILLPLGIFKKTRGVSAIGLLIASYIFGATTWVWSFLLAYVFWGFMGLFIGLFMGGIGVVPIAMLASIFHGEWAVFGQLILLVVFTFGVRFLSLYIAEKAE